MVNSVQCREVKEAEASKWPLGLVLKDHRDVKGSSFRRAVRRSLSACSLQGE